MAGLYRQKVTALAQALSLDGKRFLMIKDRSGPDQTPPTNELVQNWFEELKRLVPTN